MINPAVSASSFPSGYQSLFVDLRRLSGVTASATNVMRVYLSPTITSNGTPVVPVNLRPANSSVSIAGLYSSPTISANGTLIETLSAAALTSISSEQLIVLDPGKSLLITLQTTNSAVAVAQLSWAEI